MRDHDLIFAREVGDSLHEAEIDSRGGRVMRKVHNQELGPRPRPPHQRSQLVVEFLAAGTQGHALDLRTRDDATVLVNRVGGRGRQHHVPLIKDGERKMGDTLLGTDGYYRLGVGVQFDAVAAQIPVGDRQAQLIHAAGYRIAMVGRLGGSLDQFGNYMRGRGLIRISHAEVDYVFAGATGSEAQLADRVEDIRREPLDPWEIHLCWHPAGGRRYARSRHYV